MILSPKVSVLTTVYNGEEFISATISSVLDQSYQNLEYIIINDGSTDNTKNLLSNIKSDIVKIKNIERVGRGKALNIGLELCSGDYIAILDADDIADNDRIKIQISMITKYKKYSVLTSLCANSKNDLNRGIANNVSIKHHNPFNLIHKTKLIHSSAIIKHSALLDVNGYDEERKNLFDYYLWLKLSKKNYQIGIINKPLVYRTLHKNQFFERNNRLKYLFSSMIGRFEAIKYFSKCPLDIFLPPLYFLYGLLPQKFRHNLASKFKL